MRRTKEASNVSETEFYRPAAYLAPIQQSEAFRRLLQIHRGDITVTPVFGVPETTKANLFVSMFKACAVPMLIVCANDYAAQKLFTAIAAMAGESAVLFTSRTVHVSRAGVQSRDSQGLRAAALSALALGEPTIVVGSVDAVRAVCVPPENYRKLTTRLRKNDRIPIGRIASALANAGYENVVQATSRGQFSVRGGILDVVAAEGAAYRLDFFGDEIETISVLDPASQRSVESIQSCVIPPAYEAQLTHDQAACAMQAIESAMRRCDDAEPKQRLSQMHLDFSQSDYSNAYEALPLFLEPITAVSYLAPGAALVFDDPPHIIERAAVTDSEIAHAVKELTAKHMRPMGWEKHLAPYETMRKQASVQIYDCFAVEDKQIKTALRFGMRPVQPYHGRIDVLAGDLLSRRKQNWRVMVVLANEKRCKTFHASLYDRGVECTLAETITRLPSRGEVVVTVGAIGAGYELQAEKLLVLSEQETFASAQTKRKRETKTDQILDIKQGEYAVHDTHGIGIYRGLTTITVEGRPRDFMMLEYKGNDKLYIPAEQMARVHKYIGSEESKPKVSKMGGAEWGRAKETVKRGVKKLAQDLVSLYASRQALKGHAFSPDTPWQTEFEQSFPFDETQGQEQSIEEIKRDMESPRIMDRLLCGDVGYGKTEVATRAAFKCIMDAKQVMLLAPTTILAQQHYKTIAERFAGYPITVDVISRFKTPVQQTAILKQFAAGEIDMLIGTHRLLSKDVRPHDLGLLIIDEEQRFGVGHKETIKDIKRAVDVLTMTATPIPRTLEMSLIGIRDMSVIHTPPRDRHPINTYVVAYEDDLLREAITRELSRGGQTYVLYNHVSSMESFTNSLRALVPEATFVMANGQMPEQQLEAAMMTFYEGGADVLVCSTIIENGLDIPTANTLLVTDADRLGLAQLYQLRGRIGRSTRTAYCYFLYNAQKQLTETAAKRLEAISEFTELGSGYKIAMRDLEIRGAGNLLGPEQHGHMANVGYDTYCRLLGEAVMEAKTGAVTQEIETTVDVPIRAHIPDTYVADKELKLKLYRKIASIETESGVEDVREELTDRFGSVPEEVDALLYISLLRATAAKQWFTHVTVANDFVRLRFAKSAPVDPGALLNACSAFGSGASILQGTSYGVMLKEKDATPEKLLAMALHFLALTQEHNLITVTNP